MILLKLFMSQEKKADKDTKHKLYQLMDKIDNRLFESKE